MTDLVVADVETTSSNILSYYTGSNHYISIVGPWIGLKFLYPTFLCLLFKSFYEMLICILIQHLQMIGDLQLRNIFESKHIILSI